MANYNNSKIYMIESLEGKCRYYGSTTQVLSKRMTKHKDDLKCYYNENKKTNYKYRYLTCFEVLKYQDARILLVELFPCNSKIELEAKEAEYIRNNECVNKCIPQRDRKTYYQDNKERTKEINKIWDMDNKDKRKIICDRYREKMKDKKTNCDCGGIYSIFTKNRHLKSKKHINFIN